MRTVTENHPASAIDIFARRHFVAINTQAVHLVEQAWLDHQTNPQVPIRFVEQGWVDQEWLSRNHQGGSVVYSKLSFFTCGVVPGYWVAARSIQWEAASEDERDECEQIAFMTGGERFLYQRRRA